MKPISYSLKDVLVRQGIANAKPVGAGKVRGKIARTAGTGAAWNKVASGPVAGEEGPRWDHSPTAAGEDREPMRIREKDGAAKPRQFNREEVSNHAQEPSPARGSRPVLRLVVSNKDVRRRDPTSVAPLGLRTSLVLVVSR